MSTHDPVRESCGHLQYLLTAYLFENISDAGRKEVEEHLALCAECRAELAQLRSTLDWVEDALAPPVPDDSGDRPVEYSFEARRLERVMQAAKKQRTILGWMRRHGGLMVLAAAAAALFVVSPVFLTLGKPRGSAYRMVQTSAGGSGGGGRPMIPGGSDEKGLVSSQVNKSADYAPYDAGALADVQNVSEAAPKLAESPRLYAEKLGEPAPTDSLAASSVAAGPQPGASPTQNSPAGAVSAVILSFRQPVSLQAPSKDGAQLDGTAASGLVTHFGAVAREPAPATPPPALPAATALSDESTAKPSAIEVASSGFESSRAVDVAARASPERKLKELKDNEAPAPTTATVAAPAVEGYVVATADDALGVRPADANNPPQPSTRARSKLAGLDAAGSKSARSSDDGIELTSTAQAPVDSFAPALKGARLDPSAGQPQQPFGHMVANGRTGGADLGFVKQGAPAREAALVLPVTPDPLNVTVGDVVKIDGINFQADLSKNSVSFIQGIKPAAPESEVAQVAKIEERRKADDFDSVSQLQGEVMRHSSDLARKSEVDSKELPALGKKVASAKQIEETLSRQTADRVLPGAQEELSARSEDLGNKAKNTQSQTLEKAKEQTLGEVRFNARDNIPLTLSTTDQVQGLVTAFDWAEGKLNSDVAGLSKKQLDDKLADKSKPEPSKGKKDSKAPVTNLASVEARLPESPVDAERGTIAQNYIVNTDDLSKKSYMVLGVVMDSDGQDIEILDPASDSQDKSIDKLGAQTDGDRGSRAEGETRQWFEKNRGLGEVDFNDISGGTGFPIVPSSGAKQYKGVQEAGVKIVQTQGEVAHSVDDLFLHMGGGNEHGDASHVGGEPTSPNAELLVMPQGKAGPGVVNGGLGAGFGGGRSKLRRLSTDLGGLGGGGGGATLGLPAVKAQLEPRFRAFNYYRSLDRTLTPEVFFQQTLEIPAPAVGDEGLGEAAFRGRYGVNPFVDTSRDHFSTFGMDVDTASFTLARAMIQSGKLPEPKSVRVEEFVNYFREDVAADPRTVFTVRSEGGPAPFGDGLDLLKITVKARELLPGERKNAVLTFAVDTSGSMNLGDRLVLVRQALETLVTSLKPEDRVALVAFGASPYLVLPHTAARERERILSAVSSLAPGGSTNVEAGLDLAYRIADEVFDAKGVNRIVLCSDGVANVGVRGPDAILRKVEVFAKRGIYLSSVGFGMGKYNDSMLETLANKGNGNYSYVDSTQAAADIFQKSLPSTLQVLAQDAKIQVDFDPEVVSHYRLLGYENRDIADKDFRNDKVDAGEVGPSSTVTVLYEIRRKPSSSGDLGKVFIRYRDTGTGRVDEFNYAIPPGVLATGLKETSERFRFIACAAETAEILRQSYWARNGSFASVLAALDSLTPEFKARPEAQELTDLVTRAQAIALPQITIQEKR